jgi:hypothetical protein
VLIAPEEAQDEAVRQITGRPAAAIAAQGAKSHDQLAWEAVLRTVQRKLPGFDT